MRRIFGSISPSKVVIWSTVICLLCLELQWQRRIEFQRRLAQRQPIAKVMFEDAVNSTVNVEQVQGFAVMFRFLPPGRVESVDPIWSRPDKVPMLRVVIAQDDGSLLCLHVVLEGLEVVESPDGTVQLRRTRNPQERQMIAGGQVF